MYTEDIVAVAKRENNTKRGYLVVNKRDGASFFHVLV